jgi:predicted RNA-binding Zn-ribbon protein involved in translation (DUF1610 family)
VSNQARWLETEEQRERFHLARKRGGLCASCGRSFDDRETVYVEVFTDYGGIVKGPVGTECVSAEFLHDTQEQTPGKCAGCGRGVFYRTASSRRQRTLCSKRCAIRVDAAKRRQAED